MDGPFHYREAERLLSVAAAFPNEPVARNAYDGAHVHALLALTAATALAPLLSHYELPEDIQAWLDTTCTPETEGETEDQADDAPDDPAHVDGALDRIAGHALTGLSHDQNGGARS